jgi:CBS domain containing-hemolysin-like protein
VAAGDLDLDRLHELVGFRPNETVESTTIGGLVCEQLGQVPAPGAKLTLGGMQIEVLAADERRVNSVRVRRLAAQAGLDRGSSESNGERREGAA